MKNFFIRIALFFLRIHWKKDNRDVVVRNAVITKHNGKYEVAFGDTVVKNFENDFSELYFVPRLAIFLLSKMKPKLQITNLSPESKQEFMLFKK